MVHLCGSHLEVAGANLASQLDSQVLSSKCLLHCGSLLLGSHKLVTSIRAMVVTSGRPPKSS
eukprot:5417331-Amphidinium_carterae.1